MKVLIVEDEVEILELLKFSVEIDLAGSEIHTATGGRQAIELLEANKDFDLVICDYSMPEVSGDKVQAFIKKTSPSTKFVLCSAYTDSDKLEIDDDFLYFRITKPGITDGVKELIKMLEKPTGQEQAYIPIATSLLEKIGVAPCDIYIKLGDEKAQDSKAALGSFQKQINLLFENISSEEGAQKSVEINEFMFETAKEIGINQEVIDLGKPAIVFATNLIKKQPELKKAILKIYQDKRAYIPQHSVCTSFISCFIASKMSWASELTSCKLALASMLHDIEIDNPELIEYTVVESGEFSENFKQHPQSITEHIHGLKDLPPDIDKILLEHREQPDGSGFPNGINHQKISPLACVFIMAHKVAEIMHMKSSKNETLTNEDIMSHIDRAFYDKGNFKKIIKVLDDLEIV